MKQACHGSNQLCHNSKPSMQQLCSCCCSPCRTHITRSATTLMQHLGKATCCTRLTGVEGLPARPDELFDPSSRLLRLVFAGQHSFPVGMFATTAWLAVCPVASRLTDTARQVLSLHSCSIGPRHIWKGPVPRERCCAPCHNVAPRLAGVAADPQGRGHEARGQRCRNLHRMRTACGGQLG
jgi:hypothetical protein